MISERTRTELGAGVLERLRDLCEQRGLGRLATSLGELDELVQSDLGELDALLRDVCSHERLSERAASYLLDSGGKRLRPLCVLLAARVGSGATPAALDLAVAAELVHNATLLHDDVIDLAPARRGRATARAEYGNAASIFGGDWLLIEALRRVRRAAVPGTLDRLLDTIAAMIRAESVQLENRGRLDAGEALYFEIAEGKSATLFRWALWAGGGDGSLPIESCDALAEYGHHLGVAFQVIDDLLDLAGEPADTGKTLFTDLREGKMTYPLIAGMQRDAGLASRVEQMVREMDGERRPSAALCVEVQRRLHESGAVTESRVLAAERVALARRCLETLPQNAASRALVLVAEATVHRTH